MYKIRDSNIGKLYHKKYDYFGSTNHKLNKTEYMPKFSNNKTKFKYNFTTKPKLFSLLDINDKITNSRGTSLPMQYKRRAISEIDEDTSNIKKGFRYGFKTNEKPNLNINNEEHKSKKNTPSNRSNSENQKNNEITSNKETPNNIKKSMNTFTINKRNDRWKPQGYSEYEYLLRHPKLIAEYSINSEIAKKLPTISIKEIKKKCLNSDIFFTKPDTDKDNNKFSKYPKSYAPW